MKVGIATMPKSIRTAVEIARRAERAGAHAFGLGEGPFLHHDAYACVTACLLATDRIPIGPFVTNPVVRHWSVHAATARTLDELAPGRCFLGLGTGDGAVRSVGLRPMRWAALGEALSQIRARGPAGLTVHCTVSGPKGARAAGAFADHVAIVSGADVTSLRALGALVRAGAGDVGRAAPPELWTMIPALVVEHEADVAAAREAMRAGAYAVAHFAFAAGFEHKHVPVEYQPVIRECLSTYDYRFHGLAAEDNPNSRAFDLHPEVGDYLLDRMCLVRTGPMLRESIERLAEGAGLDGIWFPAQTSDHAERLLTVLLGSGRQHEAAQ